MICKIYARLSLTLLALSYWLRFCIIWTWTLIRLLFWIAVTGRQLIVSLDGVVSEWLTLFAGVPQGSVSGPCCISGTRLSFIRPNQTNFKRSFLSPYMCWFTQNIKPLFGNLVLSFLMSNFTDVYYSKLFIKYYNILLLLLLFSEIIFIKIV